MTFHEIEGPFLAVYAGEKVWEDGSMMGVNYEGG